MPDMPVGQAYTNEDAVSAIDLYYHPTSLEQLDHRSLIENRMSGSVFSDTPSGTLSDLNSFEVAEVPLGSTAEYRPSPDRTSLMSATFSPVTSPRLASQGRRDLSRTSSRGRTSPPRTNTRSAPYTIESRSNKRWSTGSYAPGSRQPASGSGTAYPIDTFPNGVSTGGL